MDRSTVSSNRRILALLGLVLLAGAALRVGYASGQLHINRFEDERYSLRNVRKIVGTWDFEPASGYYPSPVFNLPQALAIEASQRLAEATDTPTLRTYAEGGEMLPAAFLLTRLYQSLCGVLTLVLAFLVGRRLASPRAGLVAAFVLAFMPWMIHASGYNKPDALLVMAVLLAFHAALRALETVTTDTTETDTTGTDTTETDTTVPTRTVVGRWAWAGVAIALAMSAKLTGGLAAVPLTVGALAAPGSRRARLRRLGLLALAGTVSALAFIAMNPYWPAYLHFLRGLQTDYAKRTDASHWEIPWRVLTMPLDDFVFGPLLGAVVLASLGACAVLAVGRWRAHRVGTGTTAARFDQALGLALLLVFPVVYVAAYAAQTAYFKPNNFLPLLPFAAIALGVALDAGLRALATHAGATTHRLGVVGVAAALLLAMAPTGWSYTYNSRVPTTLDLVLRQLDERLQPPAGHLVHLERWQAPPIPWDGARPLHKGLSAVDGVDDPRDLPADVLAHAAAVVVRADGGPPNEASLGNAWSRVESWHVEPRFGRLRGPALEVMMHPARRLEPVDAPTVSVCTADCFEAPLPALDDGEVVSFFVFLPQRLEGDDARLSIELGARSERLRWVSKQGAGDLFVSPRLPAPAGVETVRLISSVPFGGEAEEGALPTADGIALEVHRWRPLR